MFLPLATFERGVCVGGGVGEAVGPEQLSSPAGKGSTHPLVLVLQLSFAPSVIFRLEICVGRLRS